MDIVSAEQFLNDQLPLQKRSDIPATLKIAYAAADLLCKQEPILQVPSARDNRGRIIQWAVDLAFEKLVNSGAWPFECRWQRFHRPTGRYLQIKLSHSLISISQVADPEKQPRNVRFRANARLSNQGLLYVEDEAERQVQGLPQFLLLHGHQTLNFSHLAMPHSRHQDGYIYRSPNLMLMPHALPSELPPAENTDIDDSILSLKEEIEKWQKDHAE